MRYSGDVALGLVVAGFLSVLVDDRRRGLHDMLAGTVVLYVADQQGR